MNLSPDAEILAKYADDSFRERFFAKVDKSTECWNWTAGKCGFGYGVVRIGRVADGTRKKLMTHRVSWWLHHGSLFEDLWVLHSCDNPACIRPDHLWLGNNSDNMRDMHAKGRGRGENTKRPKE